MSIVHDRLSRAVIMFAFACAAWGAWAYSRRQAVSSNYWGTLVIGELLVAVQGLVGLTAFVSGLRPARGVHFLYGVLVALVWPAAYIYTHGRGERREQLVYGLVSLLIVILALRATVTG